MKTITPKTGLELAARIFELARRDPIELSEQLLTNDRVEQVLQEGLILSIKQVKAHMVDTTDAALLVPRVSATYAIDEDDPETIEVTRWFAWGAFRAQRMTGKNVLRKGTSVYGATTDL